MRHSVRVRIALGAGLICVSAATSAFAHHPGGPGNTGGTGPINTISASTLAKGTGVLGVVIDYTSLDALSDATLIAAAEHAAEHGDDHAHVHSLDSITSPSLNLAYGITDDLTLALRLPYVHRRDIREGHAHEHGGHFEGEVHVRGDASGIGDLSALAQWRVLDTAASGTEAAVLLGIKAPTGKTDEKTDDGELFDAEFQPGSGSWDGLFGLALTQRVQAWSFDASVLYTAVGEGTQSTDLGDRVTYGLAVSYRVLGEAPHSHAHSHVGHAHSHAGHGHAPHAHGPSLDLVLELNGEWHDNQVAHGEADDNSGGHVLYVAPGARLAMDQWSGFVSVGVPVVNDLNGIQAEPDWRLVSGITLGF